MSTLDELNERGMGTLPGLIGLTILEAEEGRISSRLDLREELMAPNGYLHAATVVALADTSCGYGTFVNLPEGAESFTTIELKSNFVGTKRGGAIAAMRSSSTVAARRRCGTRPSPTRRAASP